MSELKNLSPTEAYRILQQDPRAILIDVRSTPEVLFVGYPVGSVHIPWMDAPSWTKNPHFVARVREMIAGRTDCSDGVLCLPLLVICRSGRRSVDAGYALLEAGFADVYNVQDGFEGDLDEHRQRGKINGWRFEALPWEQS